MNSSNKNSGCMGTSKKLKGTTPYSSQATFPSKIEIQACRISDGTPVQTSRTPAYRTSSRCPTPPPRHPQLQPPSSGHDWRIIGTAFSPSALHPRWRLDLQTAREADHRNLVVAIGIALRLAKRAISPTARTSSKTRFHHRQCTQGLDKRADNTVCASTKRRCRHRPCTQTVNLAERRRSCLGSALFHSGSVGEHCIEEDMKTETRYTRKSGPTQRPSVRTRRVSTLLCECSKCLEHLCKSSIPLTRNTPHRVPQERRNRRTHRSSERSTHKNRHAVRTRGTDTRRRATLEGNVPLCSAHSHTRAVLALRAARASCTQLCCGMLWTCTVRHCTSTHAWSRIRPRTVRRTATHLSTLRTP